MIHSASSITLANRCRRAWWHCYREKLRPPELTWKQAKRMRARGDRMPGGAWGKALGKEVHRLAEIYLTVPPRKIGRAKATMIDWHDLPGRCLHELVRLLPPAGSVPRKDVERRVHVTINGVRFQGLIDIVGAAAGVIVENYDHKTSRDIRTYALLPDAVARRIKQPARSMKDDLQGCLYVLARAKESRPCARGGLNRWNYTETQRVRRALPVVQYIPTAYARTIAERAAVVAKEVESYRSIDDATPDTLACDDYGGCWYRSEGHCTVRRKWGAVFMKLEREQKEKAEMGKPLSFKALMSATTKANEAEEKKAAAVEAKETKKRTTKLPEPSDEHDEDEDEAPESEDPASVEEAPEPAPVEVPRPKSKRKAPAPVVVTATAKDVADATSSCAHVLQFFAADKYPAGEARVTATMFSEMAEQLAQLPWNWERTMTLHRLLETRDLAIRSIAKGEETPADIARGSSR